MKQKIPLYNQIQQFILGQIQAEVWKPHEQLPPERILAENFKVSRITAKNAIIGLVAEGYLYRHRGKGTFVTDKRIALSSQEATNELQVSSAKKIGMILPWLEFRYQSLLISGIEYELSRRGYHLIFKRIDESKSLEASTIKELLTIPVDGLIIVASRGEYFHDDMLRLILEKFPLVFVEKYFQDFKVNGVYCDTEKAGYLMGQFLVSRGKKRIGYISYPLDYTVGVKERWFGFQSAVMEHGIPLQQLTAHLKMSPQVITGLNQLELHPVPDDILTFIREQPDLEAIATVDAHIAQLVGRACWQLNRYDITIIGCDEPSFAPECITPAAYIDQSPSEMGVTAAQLIMGTIEQDSGTILKRLEPKLVVLKS